MILKDMAIIRIKAAYVLGSMLFFCAPAVYSSRANLEKSAEDILELEERARFEVPSDNAKQGTTQQPLEDDVTSSVNNKQSTSNGDVQFGKGTYTSVDSPKNSVLLDLLKEILKASILNLFGVLLKANLGKL